MHEENLETIIGELVEIMLCGEIFSPINPLTLLLVHQLLITMALSS